MRQNLTERLVGLRGLRATAKRVAKLCLDHAECRFDVAALVVLLHEPLMIEFIVVVHLSPQSAFAFPLNLLIECTSWSNSPIRTAIGFERNVPQDDDRGE